MLAIFIIMIYLFIKNSAESSPRIGGVIVNVLASNVVDRGFEPRSGQTKDYLTVIACLLFCNDFNPSFWGLFYSITAE
jgi:hypothetical protein